ncbi:MAG TPA: polyprenol monophosphomannose synthase [Jatrophihabitantaceae bacterium]|nr:polyprenol monophosphomannose synthase [Jatrophihabitantaceae bacterium]
MTDRPAEPRVLVIIPTYNERENLQPIIERVHAATPAAHVLVVDDASPDGTGRIADTLAEADERVHVLHRAGKAGLGAAYIAGFDWGLAEKYDVLVEMDADGSHAPEQLPRLLAGLDNADLVLGSRWVPGGAVLDWPRSREFISRGGNLYARLALGVQLRDITGGYRAFRREVLEGIDYAAVASQGYCFQVDLAWRALRAGYRVLEVPISFADRERGESKMDGAIVREAFLRVGGWGLRHRGRQLGGALRKSRSRG